MKQTEFWKKVDQRVRENKKIIEGGAPKQMASLIAPLGLHYWIMGAGLTLVPTMWIWNNHYLWLMKWVRVLIWR